ncbi:CCAAT enhancer-binding zeta [Labeo rohita]|uniref:CCAAT/enhancer-binding protein zeta n=1 Tax=Labeo rohita TaxID=84645 RepID=A0A498M981_LABRO|nr:CCAAT enhancer-binding zeta [Labeo rohita]
MDTNSDSDFDNEDCDQTKENDKNEGELTLEDVLRLGGTKADYVMLACIDDSAELINGGKKNTIDDLEEGELEGFITKLGIRAYAEQQIIQDEQDETSSEPSKKEKKKAKSSKTKEDSQSDVKNTVKPCMKTLVQSTEIGRATGKKAKQKHINVFEFISRQTLLIKLGGKWFDIEYTSESTSVAQDESLVLQYKALAQKLYENEIALYKNKKNFQKGANSAWMKSVVSTGTLTDRMAAMTVLIQDAPVHSLEHIENLVSMVKKKGSRKQGLMASDTLKDLLLTDLLPNHRKLHTFSQHPFEQLEEKASGNRDTRDRRLILWYFEHQLKLRVAEFVAALDELAHDTVQATKMRALTTAYELLCSQPEQEKVLLIQIVNKLGDPEYKIASKASHLLETVLHKHPNMKTVLCCEVERLMFRPNISSKAQYYAACFLNQVILSHDEADLAAKLITIYITFFNACVKKKDIESKMLSALLTGVNRAYPYAKTGDDDVCKQLDTLFKVVHIVKFNTAVQALMLLFQVMDSQQTVSDRYYVALYRKLLDPGLSSSSRKSMFLNLLYKSLKADIVVRRVKAFVKRLLQVSCEQTPAFACGALFLVSEVMKNKPGLKLLLQEEAGEFIQYTGDPLQDFTLIRFLDRFVFRNPKQTKGKQNTDATVMQPKHRRTFNNIQSLPGYEKEQQNSFFSFCYLFIYLFCAVNCEEYLAKEESQIPVDEVFFYRYFKKRDTENRRKKTNKNEDNESVEDIDDDEFERVLDAHEGDSYFMEFDDDDLDFAGEITFVSKTICQSIRQSKFGCLLEENTNLKFDNCDMNAMANTDKANVKQLKWEVQRNDWIQGRDVKTLRRKKAMFNKRKFGNAKKLKSVKRKK